MADYPYFLAQTSTGKVHAVMKRTYNATPCNSRNGGFRVTRIGADLAKKIDASNFCAKCFPSGKPSDETIGEMCARVQGGAA